MLNNEFLLNDILSKLIQLVLCNSAGTPSIHMYKLYCLVHIDQDSRCILQDHLWDSTALPLVYFRPRRRQELTWATLELLSDNNVSDRLCTKYRYICMNAITKLDSLHTSL